MADDVFTLAHVSDWHATSLEGARPAELATKRFWGWQSWKRKRRKRHLPRVLERILADVRAHSPDHIVVTGDLTNVALAQEFVEAARCLRSLGPPEDVTVVPGNHDAYVAIDPARGLDRWAPYLHGDPRRDAAPAGARAPRPEDFPTLRIRGRVAIVGCNTALPTPLFMASGELGEGQRDRLESLLVSLRERGLVRVVALHHPPNAEQIAARRRLRDHAQLEALLARAGAELVVHGHRHRTWVGSLPGPQWPIPVAGVRSASDVGLRPDRAAQYHLYRIDSSGASADRPARIDLRIRGYDRDREAVVDRGERRLA